MERVTKSNSSAFALPNRSNRSPEVVLVLDRVLAATEESAAA
jgi:hypothetical protein